MVMVMVMSHGCDASREMDLLGKDELKAQNSTEQRRESITPTYSNLFVKQHVLLGTTNNWSKLARCAFHWFT